MKYRLDALEVEERERFMKVNGMGFEEVSTEDKSRRSEQLIGLAGVNQVSILKTTYYRYGSPHTVVLRMHYFPFTAHVFHAKQQHTGFHSNKRCRWFLSAPCTWRRDLHSCPCRNSCPSSSQG